MPKFKVIIDDYSCYGATIEACCMDTAMEEFAQALKDCDHNYWDACSKFDEMQDYDGQLETHWYEEENED